MEGDEPAHDLAPTPWQDRRCTAAFPLLTHQPLHRQDDTVDPAPDDEVPGAAVPQPAQQHDDHEVAVGVGAALSVAAQRHVQVVAQPARQGHVPATPEVLQGERPVRIVKVLREAEPEQECHADGDVGVTGEVRVDLDRVGVHGQHDFRPAVRPRVGEHAVDDLAGQEAGNDHLLEQTVQDQPERLGGRHVPGVGPVSELRCHLRCPHDRSGHELGEERQVHREVQRRHLADVPTADIDDVAHRLERVEGDADRQRVLQNGQGARDAEALEQVGHLDGEEVPVLEDAEDGQIGGDAEPHPQTFPLCSAVDRPF